MIENLREDLGVEKLAERMKMSSRHFTRVCLRETRMNPVTVRRSAASGSRSANDRQFRDGS